MPDFKTEFENLLVLDTVTNSVVISDTSLSLGFSLTSLNILIFSRKCYCGVEVKQNVVKPQLILSGEPKVIIVLKKHLLEGFHLFAGG